MRRLKGRAGMNIWVVINKEKLHDATIMLFPKVLKPIADMMRQDLYIIPSSMQASREQGKE